VRVSRAALARIPLSRGSLSANVGPGAHTVGMADVEILEVRAYEARCTECGETGPIESSPFFAMAWEEAHACAAIRIDADAPELGLLAG
jgi:hypothetical protein